MDNRDSRGDADRLDLQDRTVVGVRITKPVRQAVEKRDEAVNGSGGGRIRRCMVAAGTWVLTPSSIR